MNDFDVYIGQMRLVRVRCADSADQAKESARSWLFRTDAQRLGEYMGSYGTHFNQWAARLVGPRVPFKLDDRVICGYRIPTPHQYWIHPVWVGRICEPGDDAVQWNGSNSERHYCEVCGKVPVQYDESRPDGWKAHDYVGDLMPAPFGKTETWAIKDEDEAKLVDLYAKLWTRRPDHVAEQVEQAFATAGQWQTGNKALRRFVWERQVKDEAHRVRMLAEVDTLMAGPADHADLTRLKQLHVVATAAEAGWSLQSGKFITAGNEAATA